MNGDEKFLDAVSSLNENVKQTLRNIPSSIQAQTNEIRIRLNRPLGLVGLSGMLFVDKSGNVSPHPTSDSYIVDKTDMQDSLFSLCGWAVHSHQQEMIHGYISVRGGHRAGVAATAVVEDGKVTAIRDVTSINLRIARELFGSADGLIRQCFADGLQGVLLIGAPASGKTTILRDLARQLASGTFGELYKVCVVDESGELGGYSSGVIQNHLGDCCDLLCGFPKAKGLEASIRYLSPQVIICDEICNQNEIEAVTAAVNSGVVVITSIHASTFEEFLHKPQAKPLLQTGAFEQYVLLKGAKQPSQIRMIKQQSELNQMCNAAKIN